MCHVSRYLPNFGRFFLVLLVSSTFLRAQEVHTRAWTILQSGAEGKNAETRALAVAAAAVIHLSDLRFQDSHNTFLLPASGVTAADNTGILPTAEQIVTRMAAFDLQRQSSIDGYSGMRRYVFDNPKMHAEMLVHVKAERDGTKHFQIISEHGWKAANVLRKMLDSESETSQPELRATSRLNSANYDFEMVGTEIVSGRKAYVLAIKPKRKDKYLFEGRIWVDEQDYALARAEGSPAKNLSFWTKTTHFVQVYQKNGPLWFPLSMKSVTNTRFFGTTDVDIDYFDYGPENVASSVIAVLSVKENILGGFTSLHLGKSILCRQSLSCLWAL